MKEMLFDRRKLHINIVLFPEYMEEARAPCNFWILHVHSAPETHVPDTLTLTRPYLARQTRLLD